MGDDHERRIRPAWQELVSDAGDVASAMLANVDRAARWVPGYRALVGGLGALETAVLREIKDRLDHVGGRDAESVDPRPQLLHQLLADSREAKASRSQTELHLRILRSLVPDEARILATVADGARYPLLHLETRGSSPVLTNACTVGRVAAIHRQDAVCVYVGHLRTLGLLDEGPKEDALSDQYALLRNEDYVRRAVEHSGRRGIVEVKRTVEISVLGRELWAACQPSSGAGVTGSYRSAYGGLPPRTNGQERG